MEIYRVTIFENDECRTTTQIFNDFGRASELYNELCCRYCKSWGIGIYVDLCGFVNGVLENVLEIARTEY